MHEIVQFMLASTIIAIPIMLFISRDINNNIEDEANPLGCLLGFTLIGSVLLGAVTGGSIYLLKEGIIRLHESNATLFWSIFWTAVVLSIFFALLFILIAIDTKRLNRELREKRTKEKIITIVTSVVFEILKGLLCGVVFGVLLIGPVVYFIGKLVNHISGRFSGVDFQELGLYAGGGALIMVGGLVLFTLYTRLFKPEEDQIIEGPIGLILILLFYCALPGAAAGIFIYFISPYLLYVVGTIAVLLIIALAEILRSKITGKNKNQAQIYQSLAKLNKKAGKPTEYDDQCSAVLTLGELQATQAVPKLIEILESAEWGNATGTPTRIQSLAANALKKIGTPEARRAVERHR
ncbi:MAG: HEAT repeat domain-containing protein [Anaerolineae bacterium]|nr:HEAT repeat domain-containing protein [Anaerolineae bacterium]